LAAHTRSRARGFDAMAADLLAVYAEARRDAGSRQP
jgi:hypothetical protein